MRLSHTQVKGPNLKSYPKDALAERRRLAAYLRKRQSKEDCMKNVKFTPAK